MDDGRPAFPFPTHDQMGACGQHAHGGMSLRQWYAGMSIMAILSMGTVNEPDPHVLVVARRAFEIADAMIAEGKKE